MHAFYTKGISSERGIYNLAQQKCEERLVKYLFMRSGMLSISAAIEIMKVIKELVSGTIGIFNSPKCDVKPQPNTWGIWPLVGRTSASRRSVMHI